MINNMVDIRIKSLKNTSFDELFEAFRQAFAEYEMQLNRAELQAMLKRRGFDPEFSFAACNGIGDFNGIRTAYDTGTGTLKDYRGTGLATRVFESSIPYLKEAGIKEYLLEVLQHNTGAVSVYRKIGFRVTREFYYFRAENRQVRNEVHVDIPYTLQAIRIEDHVSISDFWDFKPSWQNSLEAIGRAADTFVCLGVFTEDRLVGYGVFEPVSGDVTQIAVDRSFRRKGIGSLLLQKMLEMNKLNSVKILNTDVTCDSMTAFLRSKNIEPMGKQFEMIRQL